MNGLEPQPCHGLPGFVISQLYMTSYHAELVEIMTPKKKSKGPNAHRSVRPSSVHPLLAPLDQYTSPQHKLLAPLIQLLLALLIWSSYAVAFFAYFLFSTYHLLVYVGLFATTAWRTEMLTASQPGRRVSRREFASSKTVSMEDVKVCQRIAVVDPAHDDVGYCPGGDTRSNEGQPSEADRSNPEGNSHNGPDKNRRFTSLETESEHQAEGQP